MGQPMIDINNLSASYGRGARRVNALRGVDLQVQAGEIFGLLGPNGAGKTTLLAAVEGLHRPDLGTVRVAGLDVTGQPQQVKQLLGIQLQRTALMDDLTAGELMEAYAAMYEVFPTRAEIERRLAAFDLAGQARVYPRRMSGGQQQRLALALALVNDPRIVLLDEPTGMLDPHARRAVWELIRVMHNEGRTVVITTHSMEEAEALCGRVAIIDRGQVIASGTPGELVAQLDACPVLNVVVNLPVERLAGLPGVRQSRYSGQFIEIETGQPQVTLAALQALADQAGAHLSSVTLRQPNLEDVFLSLTGRALAQ